MKRTSGLAVTKPTTESRMLKVRLSNIACLAYFCAASRLPEPLDWATSAVEPTFIAMTIVIRINFGCVVRPTAVIAHVPRFPTIIRSAIDVKEDRISSTLAGKAICKIS